MWKEKASTGKFWGAPSWAFGRAEKSQSSILGFSVVCLMSLDFLHWEWGKKEDTSQFAKVNRCMLCLYCCHYMRYCEVLGKVCVVFPCPGTSSWISFWSMWINPELVSTISLSISVFTDLPDEETCAESWSKVVLLAQPSLLKHRCVPSGAPGCGPWLRRAVGVFLLGVFLL